MEIEINNQVVDKWFIKRFGQFKKELDEALAETKRWAKKYKANVLYSAFEPTLTKFVEWLSDQ